MKYEEGEKLYTELILWKIYVSVSLPNQILTKNIKKMTMYTAMKLLNETQWFKYQQLIND